MLLRPHGTLRINLQSDYHKCDGIATNPMNILQCVPHNYSYNPIEGITIPITDVISNGGVYLLAEDLSKKEKNSKTVFSLYCTNWNFTRFPIRYPY